MALEVMIVPDIEAPGLKAHDWGVWVALCRYVAEWEVIDKKFPVKGKCQPDIEKLCVTSGWAIKQVYKALSHLETLGFVKRSNDGEGTTVYTLLPGVAGEATPQGTLSTMTIDELIALPQDWLEPMEGGGAE